MKKRLLALLLAVVLAVPTGSGLTVQAEETTTTATNTTDELPEKETETVVEKESMEVLERDATWDFEDSAQADDFELSSIDTSNAFEVTGGTLQTNGTDGVKIATLKTDFSNKIVKEVSVDIIPKDGAAFRGVVNVGDIKFDIISTYENWADAPNRIDIVPYKGDTLIDTSTDKRIISETGRGNALYSGGNKVPLTLKVTLGENCIDMTISVRDDATKYVQKTYEVDLSNSVTSIIMTAENTDLCYDNLSILYDVKNSESLVTGLSFAGTGTDSYAKTDAGLTEKPKTIEAWVKTTGTNQAIISNYTATGGMASDVTGTWGLLITGQGGLWFTARTEGTSDINASSNAVKVNTGKWTHVAVVLTDTQVDFYVNGIHTFTKEDSDCAHRMSVANPITIGFCTLSSRTFQGEIGDIRFWETERTAEQIQGSMYTELAGTEAGLTNYWTFDEQAGTVFKDKGPGGIDGTLIGAKWNQLFKSNVGPNTETFTTGLSFDGTGLTSYAKTDKGLTKKPKTIEAWVKMNPSESKKRQPIITNYEKESLVAHGNSGYWGLYTDENGYLWYTERSEIQNVSQTSVQCRTGEWMHVAIVRTDTAILFYVNGELVLTHENKGGASETCVGSPMTIGYLSITQGSLYGEIGEIRLWSTERRAEQIQGSMYTELAGTEEGLTNYWTFDEQSGTVFKDKGPGGIDGTLIGATWNTDLNLETNSHTFTTGLSFDGTKTDSYAKIEQGVSVKPRTIEAWIKTTGTNQAILSNYTSSGGMAADVEGTWGVLIDAGGELWFTARAKGNSDVNAAYNGTKVNTGEWTHIAVVLKTTCTELYVNGINVYTEEDSDCAHTMSLPNPITVGYCTLNGGMTFNGEIGDIRFWSTERTAEQIQGTIYNDLIGNEDGLTHYWTLDEQLGTVFEDKKGELNGTLEGATWTLGNIKNIIKYSNEGYNFDDGSRWTVSKSIESVPLTLEAWVKVPEGVTDNKNCMIISNKSNYPTISMEMYTYGRPRLYWQVKQTQTAVDVVAPVDLRTGEWTHVAFTCDMGSDTVVCYVNGKAVCTQTQAGLSGMYMLSTTRDGEQPYVEPGQKFYIGNGIAESVSQENSMRFVGHIADARMWDRPLSQAELHQSMMMQYTLVKKGLILNAPLDEKVDNVFQDLSGNENNIKITVRELEWVEESTEKFENGYSMVVIPDQQMMTHFYPTELKELYQWIKLNRDEENIQMVMNVGDVCDQTVGHKQSNIDDPAKKPTTTLDGTDVYNEWKTAKEAFGILPSDLPYIVVPGNHDYDANWSWTKGTSDRYNNLNDMNTYFPLSIFRDYPTESGSLSEDRGEEDNMANTWQAFEVNGIKYMIVALECNPRDDALEWANDVVKAHPNHQVIVLNHNYLDPTGGLTYFGNIVWEKFVSQHKNITMVIAGHHTSENIVRRFDKGVNGNEVVQMLMDIQQVGKVKEDHGAMLGILRFNADGTLCRVSWFSPLKSQTNCLNEVSQFTLEFPEQEIYTEAKDKFTGMNLNLDGTISFNLYTSKDHILGEDAYVRFKLPRATELGEEEPNKIGLTFDGTGTKSYAKTDKGIDTMPRTIEAWVKMNPVPEGTKRRQVIISNYTENGLANAAKGTWGLYAQDDGTGRLWWTEKVADDETSFVTLATPKGTNYYNGEWMHVAVVRTTDGYLQFYVNGTLVGEPQKRQFVGDETSKADNPLNIGYLSINDNSLDGDIGEIRLWSTERTAEQIQDNMYKELAGNEAGLKNYWTFDEQSGTVFKDKVEGGIDGTLIGAKWNDGQIVRLADVGEPTTYGYKFRCLVPAKEMADGITATLYDSNGVERDQKVISVRDYAEAVINNKNRLQSYAEASPLMKSMLHYGARSQELFEYNTVDPANKNFTAEDEVSSVTVDDLKNYAVGYQGKSGFGQMAGATLLLKGETTLRMFFTFESGADLTGLKFTVGGVEQEVERTGKYYILNFKNIAAKSLDNSYTVQVSTSAGVQFSASCSALTYCYIALASSTDEALKDASRALYLYNIRANRYLEEKAISVAEYYDTKSGAIEFDELRGFTVTNDGRLKPPSVVNNENVLGEGKVVHPKIEGEVCKSVSLDIYPNSENDIINAGIYLGVSEVDNANDAISALGVLAESKTPGENSRMAIVIGTFSPWKQLQRTTFTEDKGNTLFSDGKRRPINMKVDIGTPTEEGTPITVTLTLIDDKTKSISSTYTYTGEYDLLNGQVGFRSQIEKSSFDNFKVVTDKSTRTYTFDTEEETRTYGLTYCHSVWRGPVDAVADNTLVIHEFQTLEDGTLSTEIVAEDDKQAGIVFGADATEPNKIGLSFAGTGTKSYAQTDKGIDKMPRTIEAWVKMNPVPEGTKRRQVIISNYTENGLANAAKGTWGLYAQDDGTGRLWWTEKVADDETSFVTLATPKGTNYYNGEWMHVAVVRTTDGYLKFYVNGTLVGEPQKRQFVGDETSKADNPLNIGYLSINNNSLDGDIGEIRLWSTERTAEQIRGNMYKELAGNEAGLTNYWTFDEQSGTVFEDKGPGGIDGTLKGATWNNANGPNYYLYRMTKDYTNNIYNLQLVKVVDGTEKVLSTATLSQGDVELGINTLEVVRDGNRIYCYFNGSGEKRCYIYYEDKDMLTGNHIGLWAKTASDTDKVHFQNFTCKRE